METAIIVLAAGMGKRMDSDLPKVLHEVAGAPIIMHVLRTIKNLLPQKVVIVNRIQWNSQNRSTSLMA